MKFLKSLLAWIAKLQSTETTKMPDDLIQSGIAAAQPVAAPADVTTSSLAAPAALEPSALAGVAQVIVDTNTLKALLLTLGHDIEVEWEHLVALAKKAI